MADIARLAGVSASTVSRSLAGFGRISEETRDRVREAARKAGYNINRHARSLRLQRSGIVLVVIPDLANQNFSNFLMNVDRAAFDLGYSIMIGHTAVDLARVDRLADELFTGGIDGILLTSSYCPPRIAERLAAGEHLPVVRTISPSAERTRVATVQIDEVRAAQDVVRHLVDRGHRRIAHLAGPEDDLVARQRKLGWKRGLEEAGLIYDPALKFEGGFHLDDGRKAAERLRAAPLPDAIFCSNDESAFGLMAELKKAGIRIPLDIAVAGFDDLSFSQVFDPPLTTVRLPRREMAEASMLYLSRLIDGEAAEGNQIVPHEIMIRESS